MENSTNPNNVKTQRPIVENDDEDIEEQEDEEEEQEEDDDLPQSPLARLREQKFKLETLSRRLSSELVPIRVHDVIIRGNTKTKDWVIEAELKGIEDVSTMQELIRASEIALARLRNLGVFESSKLSLEPGPVELPNTANVVIDIVEAVNKISGEFGVYTKPSVQSHPHFLPFDDDIFLDSFRV
jgi:outer membrane protein insertion porin family